MCIIVALCVVVAILLLAANEDIKYVRGDRTYEEIKSYFKPSTVLNCSTSSLTPLFKTPIKHTFTPAGETANGSFPDTTVATMAAICANAEDSVEANARYNYIRNFTPKPMKDTEALCSSAVQVTFDAKAAAIVVITTSGRGA